MNVAWVHVHGMKLKLELDLNNELGLLAGFLCLNISPLDYMGHESMKIGQIINTKVEGPIDECNNQHGSFVFLLPDCDRISCNSSKA